MERQHLLIKGVADKIKNTATFERSAMSAVVNVCMQRVAAMHDQSQLLGKCAPLPGCRGVTVADRVHVGDVELSRGDVVTDGDAIGVVNGCFKEGATLGVFVDVAVVRRRVAEHSVVVVRTGTLAPWHACNAVLCTAWRELDLGELLVVCR